MSCMCTVGFLWVVCVLWGCTLSHVINGMDVSHYDCLNVCVPMWNLPSR